MKLINRGNYTGEQQLPHRTVEGAVPFREPQTMEELSKKMSRISLVILLIISFVTGIVAGTAHVNFFGSWGQIGLGLACSLAVMIPHEFIHAICFKGEVELFENLSQGMLFVIGTEDMSRARFVFMSLLPSIVFGVLPYAVFLIHPSFVFGAVLGGLSLAAGAGDYYNVWNALRQVPKNGMIFLSGMHSFWYIPKQK